MSRLLFVSTSYPIDEEDWKGRFIADMAGALAKRPDIELAIWAPPGRLPDGSRDVTTAGDKATLKRLMDSGGIAAQLRKGGIPGLASATSLLLRLGMLYRRQPCDIIHVNWLQNALPLWGTRFPLLVTVLGSDYGLLNRPGMVAALRSVFAQRPTILAPNAEWMVPRLETDFGSVARIHTVPFGVGRTWFQVDRSHHEEKLWIAVTRLTRNKVGHLFDWGQGLFDDARPLHLFGPMQEPLPLPPWVIWHGPTHPEELLKDWFPRATGLISLSRHDEGRPQVMLEAMAAGLPVLASDLPAHRNFIRHGETGWLAGRLEDLEAGLRALEDRVRNDRIGTSARSWLKQNIGDWDDGARRYAALYERLRHQDG